VVRAPFRIAGRVARLGRARKPGRRLRRILLIAVVVLFLLFIVPTVMIVPQEGGLASVPPELLAGVTPELSPQGTGVGVGTASVDGIPFAEVFNRVASLGLDPRLVAAVAWVETGGFAGDVIACERDSDAGARGIMQLLPGTARELGVDPCDPEQAIPGGARYLLQQHERFDDHGVGCSRPGDPEDHGKGWACDLMVSTTGRRPTPEMRAHGQAMADWLVANAEALGVQYVIWEQHIWNISRAREGWRPMADRGSVTQNHFDHVHLSVS
jgi:hypothetical protein